MNNFYYHYFSYLDGLSVAVKALLISDTDILKALYCDKDASAVYARLTGRGIPINEARYAAAKIADPELKQKAMEDYKQLGDIRFLDYHNKEYPKRLKTIYNPPLGIYVKGRLPREHIPCIAVIGARNCSDYGAKWTRYFTKELCKNNIQIISGMAKGIDGIAGRISVGYPGLSFAVLGSGINNPYPMCNKDLYESLCKNGTLISEYPPDTKAESYRFPYRNRIISGLCDAVFVAEAAARSGSLITAYFALEQGKEVLALPGPIDSPLSAGTNILIKNGAYPVLSVEDILNV